MSFHVLEAARMTDGPLGSDTTYGNNGAFLLPSIEPGWTLVLIASDEDGWEHVSVRAARSVRGTSRVPTWREMSQVKNMFWDGEDVVIQYHPRKSEYVNIHPHVLHLWRPTGVVLPTPPAWMVGVTDAG